VTGRRQRKPRGATIAELLIVMAAGAVFLNVAFTLFLAQRRLVLAGLESSEGFFELTELGCRFRRDMLEAVEVLPAHGDHRTGHATLALSLSDGTVRVYHFEDERLQVLSMAGEKVTQDFSLRERIRTLRFDYEHGPAGRVRLVTMRIERKGARRDLARIPQMVFAARVGAEK